MTLVLGIDVGATRTKAGIVDSDRGELVALRVIPTNKVGEKAFFDDLQAVVRGLFMDTGTDSSSVKGIGVAVPGLVDETARRVVTTCGFLEFFEDFALADRVEALFSLPASIENDARACALGEYLYDEGGRVQRLVVLTLGTGVGLGRIFSGKLFPEGGYDFMGGHLIVDVEGPACYCGARGCLEAYASAKGMLANARRRLQSGRGTTSLSHIEASSIRPEDIFDDAAVGDPLANQVVDELLLHLAAGLHTLVQLYFPNRIVLGGGMARSLAPYLHRLQERLDGLPLWTPRRPRLALSSLGDSAGVFGAAALMQRAT